MGRATGDDWTCLLRATPGHRGSPAISERSIRRPSTRSASISPAPRVSPRLPAAPTRRPPPVLPQESRMHGNLLLLLLLQIALILALSRAMGWLFNRFHQPQV